MKLDVLDLERFKKILPSILMGRRTKALFATYNQVGGRYRNGNIETGVPDLEVTIQTGGLEYSPQVNQAMYASIITNSSDPLQSQMEYEAATAMAKVSRAVVNQDVDSDLCFVAFIYTGLSGFKSSYALAKVLRDKNPSAVIIFTMCDCGEREHREDLSRAVEEGVANYLISSRECGGYSLMGNLVDALIENFKHRQEVPV